MSRVGLKPVTIPSGVTVEIEGNVSKVKGPKGELLQHIPSGLTYSQEDGFLTISRPDDSKNMRAIHGLVRALVANQVTGVTEGFKKRLEIIGVGYKAEVKVLDLQLQFSHPVNYPIPAGIEINCPSPTTIEVLGADKQQVGQVAAEIRAYRKPEPYKGKGIRYQDEIVIRKAGKAASK
jgi:large subunit ribosomal protein L6